jgi:Mlc titration factor MtfA (ptsG expression regulator)
VIGRLWQAWRQHAEARALARRAIPDDLWRRTLVRYPFLRRRDPAEQAELRRLTSLFLDRKEFSGASGLRMRNDMVVAIAAQAVLPVLKLGLDRYDGFVGIVVHPHPVRVRRQHLDDDGVQHEYDEELAGEAMDGGPIMLSWHDVRSAGRQAGPAYNVVIHEFAHVLDLADGLADGVPLLPRELPRERWTAVMQRAYADFVQRVDSNTASAFDAYGSTGPGEFFAVASETFFVTAQAMKEEDPALYELFARFYRQDPAAG